MSDENHSDWGPIGDTVAARIITEYGEQFAIEADKVLPADTIRDFRVCAVVAAFLDTDAELQTRIPGYGVRTGPKARYDFAVREVAKTNTSWTADAIRAACLRHYNTSEGRTDSFVRDLQTIEDRLHEPTSPSRAGSN